MDIYCSYKEVKTIWEALIKKFTVKDSNKQKFIVRKYYYWQINEYQKLLEDLKSEDIILTEKFVVGVLIGKLLDSWNDYKNVLNNKQKAFIIEELVTHILIEDTN